MRSSIYELRPSNNIASASHLLEQLSIGGTTHSFSNCRKVVILDLDDSGLEIEDLLGEINSNDDAATKHSKAQIKQHIENLHRAGTAFCLVTNKTLFQINPQSKQIEPNTAEFGRIVNLHKHYPDHFDFFVCDPENPSNGLVKDSHKKDMLAACVKAYPKGSQFCYLGHRKDLLTLNPKEYQLKTINILDKGDSSQHKQIRLGLAAITFARVSRLFSDIQAQNEPTGRVSPPLAQPSVSSTPEIRKNPIRQAGSPSANTANTRSVSGQPVLSRTTGISDSPSSSKATTTSRGQYNPGQYSAGRPELTDANLHSSERPVGLQSPAPKSRLSTQGTSQPSMSGHNAALVGAALSTSAHPKDFRVLSGRNPGAPATSNLGNALPRQSSQLPQQRSSFLSGSMDSDSQPLLSELEDDAAFDDSRSLIKPATKIASLGFREWFVRHFIKSPLLTEAPDSEGKSAKETFKEAFKNLLNNLFFAPFKALVLIYPFDGYDPVTNQISYAAGATKPEQYEGDSFKAISIKLLIATFLGFASRAIKGPYGPTITFKQILKNFVGGVDWDNKTPAHKKRLQLAGIPLKALIILPIKLITLPLKAILNAVKLLTEFLPWLATTLSYIIYRGTLLGAYYSWQGFQALRSKSRELADTDSKVNQSLGWGAILPIGGLFFLSLALALTTVPLFLGHVACRMLMVIGRSITSPLLNLRMAYAFGSELKLPVRSEKVQFHAARFIGILGAGISLALTIITWAIIFPLIVGYAMTEMPTLMSIVNAFVTSAPVVNTLTTLHSATTAVGAFLHSAFGAAVTGLSNFVGVQVTYTAIVTMISTPFILALTRLADKLSDRWANWHEGEIFKPKNAALANLNSPSPGPKPGPLAQSLENQRPNNSELNQNSRGTATGVREMARKYVKDSRREEASTKRSFANLDSRLNTLENRSTEQVTVRRTAIAPIGAGNQPRQDNNSGRSGIRQLGSPLNNQNQ